jgi:hypothetical protein
MSTSPVLPARRPLSVAATIVAVTAFWLAAAQPAQAATAKPALELGPVIVLNGHATVTGYVRGIHPAVAAVTVNGRPVGLNLQGGFLAIVNLGGASGLVLEVVNTTTGERSTVSIPLYTGLFGLGGLLLPGVLDQIDRAAVQILGSVNGFVTGTIASTAGLVSVTINDIDVLKLLDDLGRFTIPIPGTSRSITIVIVDNRGVESTTTLPVAPPATTPPPAATPPPATRSVKAPGLRVAGVRYVTKHFRRTKRVQMIVTIKDTLGRPVRGATVQVRAASPKGLRLKPKVKRTGKGGRVAFLLHPRARVFGKRLTVVTVARKATAKAQRKTSVRVPKPRTRTITGKRG